MFASIYFLLVATMLGLTLTHTWDVSMETVLRATMFGGFSFWLVDHAKANLSLATDKSESTAAA